MGGNEVKEDKRRYFGDSGKAVWRVSCICLKIKMIPFDF